ncbi:MAG: hypothetical protein OHK005_07630 [Candidatus Methylacidiphilales bacterium]
MKILLVSSSSGSQGGGELFLWYLGKGLQGLGCDVVLWASAHRRMDALCERFTSVGDVVREAYVNTYDQPLRSLAGALASSSQIKRLAKSLALAGADVVHLNKQNLEDGLDLVRATELLDCPVVGTIHLTQTESELGAYFGWFRDRVSARILSKFRGPLVTVSEARRRALAKFLQGARTLAIPNGVSLPDREVEKETGRFCVVAVGRLMRQKRPERFVQAAVEIRRVRPEAFFIWVGGGRGEADFSRLAAKMGLGQVLKVTGWVEEVGPWLEKADLVLHPALFEGLPLAVLEAVAYGLPVVVSQEVWEELPRDLQDVTLKWPRSGFADLLMEEERLLKVGRRGREVVACSYSEGAMAGRYLELYRSLR